MIFLSFPTVGRGRRRQKCFFFNQRTGLGEDFGCDPKNLFLNLVAGCRAVDSKTASTNDEAVSTSLKTNAKFCFKDDDQVCQKEAKNVQQKPHDRLKRGVEEKRKKKVSYFRCRKHICFH